MLCRERMTLEVYWRVWTPFSICSSEPAGATGKGDWSSRLRSSDAVKYVSATHQIISASSWPFTVAESLGPSNGISFVRKLEKNVGCICQHWMKPVEFPLDRYFSVRHLISWLGQKDLKQYVNFRLLRTAGKWHQLLKMWFTDRQAL